MFSPYVKKLYTCLFLTMFFILLFSCVPYSFLNAKKCEKANTVKQNIIFEYPEALKEITTFDILRLFEE